MNPGAAVVRDRRCLEGSESRNRLSGTPLSWFSFFRTPNRNENGRHAMETVEEMQRRITGSPVVTEHKEPQMAGKFKAKGFWASWGKYKVNKGVLLKTQVEKESQRWVDIRDYAQKLQDAYEQLDAEGYEVISVVPLSCGSSESATNRRGAYLGDTGFTPTQGAVVVGKKRGG